MKRYLLFILNDRTYEFMPTVAGKLEGSFDTLEAAVAAGKASLLDRFEILDTTKPDGEFYLGYSSHVLNTLAKDVIDAEYHCRYHPARTQAQPGLARRKMETFIKQQGWRNKEWLFKRDTPENEAPLMEPESPLLGDEMKDGK